MPTCIRGFAQDAHPVDKAPRGGRGTAGAIIIGQNRSLSEPTIEFGRAPADINSNAGHEWATSLPRARIMNICRRVLENFISREFAGRPGERPDVLLCYASMFDNRARTRWRHVSATMPGQPATCNFAR
jgi:hypothetical protein